MCNLGFLQVSRNMFAEDVVIIVQEVYHEAVKMKNENESNYSVSNAHHFLTTCICLCACIDINVVSCVRFMYITYSINLL